MERDLLVFLRVKDPCPAKRRGMIVAPALKDDTGPVEPTANRGAHLYIVFSDTAGKHDEVHSAEHGRVRHCACP